MHLVKSSALLLDVMRLMEKKAHRVGVLDENEQLSCIFSQVLGPFFLFSFFCFPSLLPLLLLF